MFLKKNQLPPEAAAEASVVHFGDGYDVFEFDGSAEAYLIGQDGKPIAFPTRVAASTFAEQAIAAAAKVKSPPPPPSTKPAGTLHIP